MNLEEIGEKLLCEVKEEALLEVASSIRELYEDHDGTQLNIPSIDRVVQTFTQGLRKSSPPVIELISSAPGSGTTHLLYYLIAVAVLPKTATRSSKGGTVVVIDADGNFDVERLAQVMLAVLVEDKDREQNAGCIYQLDPVWILEQALQYVCIVQPQSLSSLNDSVKDLGKSMFDLTIPSVHDRAVELIALDGMAAFYWQDLMQQNEDSEGAHDSIDDTLNGSHADTTKHKNIVENLRFTQSQFGCPIVLTSIGMTPISHHGAGEYHSFRPVLPNLWQSICTISLVVAREPVKKFYTGISFEQAQKDSNARSDVVEEGRYCAWLNRWGSSNWTENVREALGEDDRNHRFHFRITNEGIKMLED